MSDTKPEIINERMSVNRNIFMRWGWEFQILLTTRETSTSKNRNDQIAS